MVSPLRQRRSIIEENGCSPNNFTRASLSVKFNFPICGNLKLKVQASQPLSQISRSEITAFTRISAAIVARKL